MKIKKEQIYLRWTYETKLNSKYPIQGYEIEIYGKPTIKNSNIIIGQCESIIGSVTTGEYSNWDYEEKHHSVTYTVVTSADTFRFRIFLSEKDSRSKDNIGITRLYVLKLSEDEYPNELYVGALVSEDGIHVAYPHELPKD